MGLRHGRRRAGRPPVLRPRRAASPSSRATRYPPASSRLRHRFSCSCTAGRRLAGFYGGYLRRRMATPAPAGAKAGGAESTPARGRWAAAASSAARRALRNPRSAQAPRQSTASRARARSPPRAAARAVDRRLDRDHRSIRSETRCQAGFGQSRTQRTADRCRHHVTPGGLGHDRDRPRCPRVGLDHDHALTGNDGLDVHDAPDAERHGDPARGLGSPLLRRHGDRPRRARRGNRPNGRPVGPVARESRAPTIPDHRQ